MSEPVLPTPERVYRAMRAFDDALRSAAQNTTAKVAVFAASVRDYPPDARKPRPARRG